MSGLRPHIRAAWAYSEAAMAIAGEQSNTDMVREWERISDFHARAAENMQAEHDAEYRSDIPDEG